MSKSETNICKTRDIYDYVKEVSQANPPGIVYMYAFDIVFGIFLYFIFNCENGVSCNLINIVHIMYFNFCVFEYLRKTQYVACTK